MSKRKFTRNGEKPVAYKCCNKNCKWEGIEGANKQISSIESEKVCPLCGGNEFYGLLELPTNKITESLYYVRNEGYLGNALLWWKEGCNGYTCDIKNAHKFTKEEAESTCRRPQDTAYECDYIDNLLVAQKLIIDCQYVDSDKQLFNS